MFAPDQFLSIANLFSEAALLLTNEGTVLAGNRNVQRLGLSPPDLVGKHLSEFTNTEREKLTAFLKTCARTSERTIGSIQISTQEQPIDCRCEGCAYCSNGQSVLLLKLIPKNSDNDHFALLTRKINELTTEIQQRHRLEMVLRQQTESLQVTLASIGDGVIVTDSQARVQFLNQVAESLTGWTSSEANGQHLDDVFRILNEHTRQPVQSPVDKVLEHGKIVGLANHTILISRDGTERAIDDSAAPIRDTDGKVHGVVLVFRDISEKRQAELERLRLASIVDSSDDAIIGYSIDGHVTSWNQEAERLFGYSEQEVLHKHFSQSIVPRDRVEELTEILQRIGQGDRVEHFETIRKTKEGRILPVSVRLSPIRDNSGNIVGVSAIDRDLSFQRAMQQRRGARSAIANILAQSAAGHEIIEKILKTTCTCFDWSVGCYWRLEDHSQALRCEQAYTHDPRFEGFLEVTRQMVLPQGNSLPGRVWQQRRCIWLPDLHEEGFLRETVAFQAGLRAGFACPIQAGDRFLGILEFFSNETQRPDEDLLELVSTIGDQIGQFFAKRAAEERILFQAQLLDSVGQAAVATDPHGKIIYLNRYAEALYGWNIADALGMDVLELVAPSQREQGRRLIDQLRRGESWSGELQVQRRNGATFPAWITEVPVFDNRGHLTAMIGVSFDISAQKRRESTLRFLADASRSLATLVDFKSTLHRVANLAVPDFADWCAVDVVQPDGQVERLAVAHVDPTMVRHALEISQRYPHDPQAPRGVMYVVRTGNSDMLSEIPPDFLDQVASDEKHRRLLQELNLKSYICVPLKVSGRVFGVLTFASCDPNRLYTTSDLTIAEDLAHRACIAIENAQLYQQVKEADRRKDEFLAMLAHELRNPLAPIRSGLDILSMTVGEQHEVVDLMQQQVAHLVRLVDDLLDVSRIMQGKIELRPEPIKLSRIVHHAVDSLMSAVESKGHLLSVEVDEDLLLNADPVRMTQIVQNLLSNACKYTDDGGRISITAIREGEQAVLAVEDNGIGIEECFQPKVFELFSQSARSLDRSQGGLGIGLTLVQTLVQMHRGTVSVASNSQGKGSRFTVRLPLLKTIPAAAPVPIDEGIVERRCVLVVDDNADAAKMLKILIRQLGPHEVHVAHDGPETIELAEQLRPDIILLDIGLPRMDGYVVAQRLRETGRFEDTVIVALTGYGQEDDRKRSQRAGFDHHYVKPVSVEALREIIQSTR